MSTIIRFTALLISLSTARCTKAADYVWTGAKDNDWHTAANWSPATGVPGKGDHAIIAGLTAATTIRLSRETPVGSLTFDPKEPLACTLEGQPLLLGDGAKVQFKALGKTGKDGSQTIACPLQLSGRVEFRNDNRWYLGAERLTLSGPISGSGEFVVSGPPEGTVIVSGTNTGYTGTVAIESGTLLMANNDALGSGPNPVRMLGGELNLGSRITCRRSLAVEADATWSGQTYCTMSGTVTVSPDVTWRIRNGGGCPTTLSSKLEGGGHVLFGKGTTLAGDKASTLTGVMTIAGETRLNKPKGVTFAAGPVVISGLLCWCSDDQVADTVPVTFNGKQAELHVQGHSETMGTLDVQSDATIDVGTNSARLVFADSSGKAWKPGSALIIRSAGRDADTIRVGATGKGLTAGQLAQIGFRDPAGQAPGTYTAALTPKGELVPTGKLVQAVDLPVDRSPKACEARRALYDVPGIERLGGHGTPLRQGMVISVFGDSITWGGGLVKTLQDGVTAGAGSKSLGVRVINHGVNGAGVQTIRDGQDSKNHAGGTKPEPFAQTIAGDKSAVAVIFIGVNDVWWKKSTPEEYGTMLRELVAQAKANKTVPVLATLALLKDSPLKPNPQCDVYAEVMRNVARETGTVLIDVRAAFMACLANEGITVYPGGRWTCNDTLLNHDGVHTTGRGDQVLANMIAQGIYEALKK
ncbi:MAG: GDSL-type esterase/lipase family protein [bacterium]